MAALSRVERGTQAMAPKAWSVAALAEHWECSTTFVYQQIACGNLRAWKLGGKLYRIPLDAVEEYEARALVTVSATNG